MNLLEGASTKRKVIDVVTYLQLRKREGIVLFDIIEAAQKELYKQLLKRNVEQRQ